MPDQPAKRTLTTIFYADVVDYSRLTGLDEEGTHNRVMETLDNVSQKISSSGGKVLRYAGDAILATFPSVVRAVETSTDIQSILAEDNAPFPEETRVHVRIGINLGDVIEDRGEVFGDGVNLAARLEAAAEPGGICISSMVWEQCQGKINSTFADGGEHQFKNISRPIHTFHWQPSANEPGLDLQKKDIPLSDKPTIAVLPFDNMSGDPEQEYFSDGITEDIITQLTRFRSLFVIARNSSFAFKGMAVDVTEIGKKLGVQFVVEGSVRKAGDRIRITAQLIEVSSGNHLWAERYDRSLSDIFAVQDEVTSQIVTMVPGHMDIANRVKAERKSAQNMNAYDLFLRANHILHWNLGSREGEQLLKQALEIDPSYAQAHARLAAVYANGIFAHGLDVDKAAASAHIHAETAMKLDPTDPMIHASLADVYIMAGEHALAAYHIDKAIALNPNQYEVMVLATEVKGYLGDYHAAIKWANKAKLSDPYLADNFRETIFEHHYIGGQYELALEQMTGWRDPGPYNYLEAAAAFAQLDRKDEAQEAIQQFEDIRPEGWNMEEVIRAHVRMCAKPEDGERWVEGFRKAGVEI